MNLAHYISQALYRYPCVIIPNFGAFVTEPISAKISELGQHMIPPSKKIIFNTHITNNDGLLAQLLCVGENCPYDVAIQKIEAQVTYWKLNLDKNHSLLLDHIGEIVSKDGQYIFTQNNENNYLTDSFGLSTMQTPAIKREAYKAQVEAIEEVAPIFITPENEEEKTIKKSSNWYKYAAVFFLGLGVSAYFGHNLYQDKIEKETQIAHQIAQEKVEENIQKATFFLSEKLLPVTLNVAKAEEKLSEEEKAYEVTYFHVVGGAFKSVRNAYIEMQNLTKKGYNARIGGKNKYGYYLVLFESFKTKQEAYQALDSIQSADNPEAWILTKPL
jgi:hypothetical protein